MVDGWHMHYSYVFLPWIPSLPQLTWWWKIFEDQFFFVLNFVNGVIPNNCRKRVRVNWLNCSKFTCLVKGSIFLVLEQDATLIIESKQGFLECWPYISWMQSGRTLLQRYLVTFTIWCIKQEKVRLFTWINWEWLTKSEPRSKHPYFS